MDKKNLTNGTRRWLNFRVASDFERGRKLSKRLEIWKPTSFNWKLLETNGNIGRRTRRRDAIHEARAVAKSIIMRLKEGGMIVAFAAAAILFDVVYFYMTS